MHPRSVGVFTLGAVALILGTVVLLSSGAWLAGKQRFSVFFPGSVRGLNQGAAVTFRGVRIGQVVEVAAFLTGKSDPLVQIEVVLEVRTDIVRNAEDPGGPFAGLSGQEFANDLIRRGLRARMLSASLLTGQRYIDLDFTPGEPARLAGLSPHYPELPTTPSALEKLGDRAEEFLGTLADLPLEEMLQDVRAVIHGLRETVSSDRLRDAIVAADRSLNELGPVLADSRRALKRADTLMDTLDTEATGTGESARASLEDLRRALTKTESTLATLERTLQAADDTRVEAAHTLAQLQQTLAVMRNLAEYVQTHPEAVVLGKPPEERP